MPVGPNFSSRTSSLIGSLFPPTAKRNNGHRRRSTAAAYDFVRTKVKEKQNLRAQELHATPI
jgi:hypothetical protein